MIDEILVIKDCYCKAHLIGKLVLKCEDDILTTTENSINEKKVTCKKNNCFIHTISLITVWLLLLVVICESCHFYYTKYRSKQKYLLPSHDANNKLNEIYINNIVLKWVINLGV